MGSLTADRAEARALMLLRAIPGVGDVTLHRLVERFGSGSAALEAPADDFAGVAGTEAAAARSAPEPADAAERGLAWCRSNGAQLAVRGRPPYPERLLHLTDPPAFLFLRGDPSLLEPPVVTVVGSRRSTAYGRRVATEVARAVVRAGVTVASGLALGIDAAAHRAALEAGGRTLAVLGTGLDVEHPPSNRGLSRRIGAEGLLVTEFMPGDGPQAHNFPRRNRILAALAQVVVVVEAARRSGALITADHALSLGREIVAVPGSIYAPGSQGTNRLVRVGAHALVDPEQVLDYLPDYVLEREGEGAGEPVPPDALGPDVGSVWSVLGPEGRHVDELASDAALDSRRTLAALTALELAGWVQKESGMRFIRVGSARGGA